MRRGVPGQHTTYNQIFGIRGRVSRKKEAPGKEIKHPKTHQGVPEETPLKGEGNEPDRVGQEKRRNGQWRKKRRREGPNGVTKKQRGFGEYAKTLQLLKKHENFRRKDMFVKNQPPPHQYRHGGRKGGVARAGRVGRGRKGWEIVDNSRTRGTKASSDDSKDGVGLHKRHKSVQLLGGGNKK